MSGQIPLGEIIESPEKVRWIMDDFGKQWLATHFIAKKWRARLRQAWEVFRGRSIAQSVNYIPKRRKKPPKERPEHTLARLKKEIKS